MASYTQQVQADGFEINCMKRLVERGSEPLTLLERMTAGYFWLANTLGDRTYHVPAQADERRAVWQAFLSSNLLPMRFYIENHAIKAKWAAGR